MRFALVTGAGKGIGKAIATRLAAEGCHLFITSRTASDLQNLQAYLENKFKVKVHYLIGDIASAEFCKNLLRQVEKQFPQIDLLINNAGNFVQDSLIRGEEGLVQDLFSTNVLSAFRMSRYTYPLLQKSERAHIFNICSIAGLHAYPNSGAYTISKFAMLGLSRSLRLELQNEGIRVTAIHPGATLTASWEGVDLPSERFIKPEDIAEILWSAYCISTSANVDEILVRPSLGDIG